ncbi:MAG: hypothetical protein ACOY9C_02415 [Pseudomonadota bacterium]
MRFGIAILAAAGALSLAACNSPADKAAEQKADAVEAQTEQKADALENKADAVERRGEAQADRIEQQAGKKD